MNLIPAARIRSYDEVNGFKVPSAVDAVCPTCRSKVTYRFDKWQWDAEVRGKPKSSSCPGCQESAQFLWIGAKQNTPGTDARLYIDAEDYGRHVLPGLELVPDSEFSSGLRKAYESALNVLNVGEAEAASASIRRVLEGLIRQLVPSDKANEPLARRLNRLTESVDLNAPLNELTRALKDGGNLATHFDEDVTTSIEDAKEMLDFLEFFIEYVYILPRRVDSFRRQVIEQRRPQSAESPEGADLAS